MEFSAALLAMTYQSEQPTTTIAEEPEPDMIQLLDTEDGENNAPSTSKKAVSERDKSISELVDAPIF